MDLIGSGASAAIYRAFDQKDQVNVALKVYDLPSSSLSAARTSAHEFEIIRRLEHPNVIRALDHGNGYITLELVRGVLSRRPSAKVSRLSSTRPRKSPARSSSSTPRGSSIQTSRPKTSSSAMTGRSGSRISALRAPPRSAHRRKRTARSAELFPTWRLNRYVLTRATAVPTCIHSA
jgi:hypothetical protein